ncbi:hypothetical protein P3T37_007193 [Kitasatospora sp. MAA4]|uniref:DUF6296 family protein n=1 Tax=Kitasatospora sp. MAA4 TaxID=3035093 RepID=UPI00247505A3|nr:DUF6296 family protein [Kitasatospora sp. MAA4]MDH6137760.1 hypothetical protein [Kitasatospora sp. MAA4]
MSTQQYELIFTRTGAESGEDVVLVSLTGTLGPGGHPVYVDTSGIVRAEISDQGEVRMLATGGHQDLAQHVVARPR